MKISPVSNYKSITILSTKAPAFKAKPINFGTIDYRGSARIIQKAAIAMALGLPITKLDLNFEDTLDISNKSESQNTRDNQEKPEDKENIW